jgi:hypothetical protein
MTARRRTEGPRAAALVLVLALHGLLLWHGSAVRPDARFESRAPAPGGRGSAHRAVIACARGPAAAHR